MSRSSRTQEPRRREGAWLRRAGALVVLVIVLVAGPSSSWRWAAGVSDLLEAALRDARGASAQARQLRPSRSVAGAHGAARTWIGEQPSRPVGWRQTHRDAD